MINLLVGYVTVYEKDVALWIRCVGSIGLKPKKVRCIWHRLLSRC